MSQVELDYAQVSLINTSLVLYCKTFPDDQYAKAVLNCMIKDTVRIKNEMETLQIIDEYERLLKEQ